MRAPSFNVLSEPWIPVLYPNGSARELGIVECLSTAHEIQEIRDPSPIVEFGLYRLLVAFVLDALILEKKRPEIPEDLQALLQMQSFDPELIPNYVDRCGEVFDLFDPDRPFLQVPMPNKESKPVAGLCPAVPSGTNVVHFHHAHEDQMSFSPAEAARWLTTVAPFMTAGGAGLSPSINGAPAIYALPLGGNLFETIVLNLPTRQQEGGSGLIAWRAASVPGGEKSQATTPEALTWRPRCIQLVPPLNEASAPPVSRMRFERGDKATLSWIDPSLAYKYDGDNFTPIRMREDRPLWRDAGPLALLRQRAHGSQEAKVAYQRPDVVENAFAVNPHDKPMRIALYGMRTDMKMKIFEWDRSVLSIPANLGRSTRLGAIVQSELDLADNLAYQLRNAVKRLYPRDGASNKAALGQIASRAGRGYWRGLEPEFPKLMAAFAGLPRDAADNSDTIDAARNPWRDAITGHAKSQFELAAQDMDADSDALERQVRARDGLQAAIKKVLP